MNQSLFVMVVILAGPSVLGAATSESAGLEQAVAQVLQRNAGLKAAEARLQSAEAASREMKRKRLPFLSARSSLTRGDQPVYVFGSLLEQGRFGPEHFAIDSLNNPDALTNIKSALDLGVPVFTGFDLTSAARQSELRAQEARSSREEIAQALRLQAASAYLRLLLSRDLLNELKERLAASKEELEEARRLKERGVVLGSDYYAAQAIYNGLQAWNAQTQAQERAHRSDLEILTGQSPVQVRGQWRDASFPVPSLQDARTTALARRPDLAGAATQAAQAQDSASQARKTWLPHVEGFATLETNTNDFDSNPTNHLYGVTARIPFGDPGYFARRDRAAFGEASARSAHQSAEDSALMEVTRAWEMYQGVIESLPLAKAATENAAQSLRLFRPLYRSGRQSIIEVLRAEEALARAKASYWQTLYEAHAGYLHLMKTIGALDEPVIGAVAQRLEIQP